MAGEVDEARKRYLLLARILDAAKTRAIGDPLGRYVRELGIVEAGDKRASATEKVGRAFEELNGLLAHMALMDMTASLERAFMTRLSTALGEARKTLREKYDLKIFHSVREGFVSELDRFQGLVGLENLLAPKLSDELKQGLKTIRAERNKFAHGTDVSQPPLVEIGNVYATLSEVADAFLADMSGEEHA